jgi:uncharacterized protein YjiS (DUF1127 family)
LSIDRISGFDNNAPANAIMVMRDGAMLAKSKSVISRSMLSMQRWARTYILWQLKMSKRSLVRALSKLDDEQLNKLGIRRNGIESLVTAVLEVLAGATTETSARQCTEAPGAKVSASTAKSCAFVSAICREKSKKYGDEVPNAGYQSPMCC